MVKRGRGNRRVTEASMGFMGMFAEDETPSHKVGPVDSVVTHNNNNNNNRAMEEQPQPQQQQQQQQLADLYHDANDISGLSNTMATDLQDDDDDDSTSTSSEEEEEEEEEEDDCESVESSTSLDENSSNEEEESIVSDDSDEEGEEIAMLRENKAIRVGDKQIQKQNKKRLSDTTTSSSHGSSDETDDGEEDSEGEYLDDGEYDPEDDGEEEDDSDSDSEDSELCVVHDPEDEVALMTRENVVDEEEKKDSEECAGLCKTMGKLSIQIPEQSDMEINDEDTPVAENMNESDEETESEAEDEDLEEESFVDHLSPRKMVRKKTDYPQPINMAHSASKSPQNIQYTHSEDEGMMEIHTDDDDLDIFDEDSIDETPTKEPKSDETELNEEASDAAEDDDDDSSIVAEVVNEESESVEEDPRGSDQSSASIDSPKSPLKENHTSIQLSSPICTSTQIVDHVASLYADDSRQKDERPPLSSVKVSKAENDYSSMLSFDASLMEKENTRIGDELEENEHDAGFEQNNLPSRLDDNLNENYFTHKTPKPRSKTQRTKKKARRGIKPGKWSLGSKIGKGAFGVVHVGMNTETGRLMAVKSIRMEGVGMKDLRREIDLLRSLEHENIVQYYGALQDKGNLRIFQEWVAGGSVTELLDKFGPFTLDVCRTYLFQILSGLSYLHENNIMHRDIKGSNILVSNEGVVKLADFGASRKISKMQSDLMMSLTMRGTPYFMAPEVFEEKYSSKADIWAVGCVGYQMVTGRPPWKELGFTSPVALFNHVKNRAQGPEYDLKDGNEAQQRHFRAVMDKCYAIVPTERPTASILLEEAFFVDGPIYADQSFADEDSLHSPSPSMHYMSPSTLSVAHKRRSSVGGQQSPFLSPPIPRSAKKRQSNHQSPAPDMSAWPSWAKSKYKESQESLKEEPTESGGAADSLIYSTGDYSENPIKRGLASPLGTSRLENSKASEQTGLDGLLYLSSTS